MPDVDSKQLEVLCMFSRCNVKCCEINTLELRRLGENMDFGYRMEATHLSLRYVLAVVILSCHKQSRCANSNQTSPPQASRIHTGISTEANTNLLLTKLAVYSYSIDGFSPIKRHTALTAYAKSNCYCLVCEAVNTRMQMVDSLYGII